MKKLLSALAVSALLVLGAAASAQADDITVMLDNEAVEFDQQPIITDNRTLVPVRAVFEKAGALVEWDQASLVATITKGNYTIRISPDSDVMYKNGRSIALDVPAQIINNRILIPVRAISEAMDFKVTWNGYLTTVLISTDSVPYRAFAGVKRGFRDMRDIADLYIETDGKGFSDLDGDGSLETIEFKKMTENEGQDGVLVINGTDYTSALSHMASAGSVAAININNASTDRQLVVVENGDVNTAHFFTFDGSALTECEYSKPVSFSTRLLFDEKKYILSDLHGFLFTDIMVTGSYYEFNDNDFGYYRTGASVREIAPRTLTNVYDDGMLYRMIVTDKYDEGAYKNAATYEKVYSQTFETFNLLNIYVDDNDPSYFEFYIEMEDGTKAVIMPYTA
ncbi:MAG: copper amine oxidase N-terminal domain-containing protein [Clostridiales bacterium]|nr:copper amine oxidase N-terminal domain-containing protein [Clostridiales bacterium]